MKKNDLIFMLSLCILLTAFSCKKEKDKPESSKTEVTAVMEQFAGIPESCFWQADDVLNVFGPYEQQGHDFTLALGAGRKEGDFSYAGAVKSPYYAFFGSTSSSARVDRNVLNFNIPDVQPYKQGGVAHAANPMFAFSEDGSLLMRNLFGLLEVQACGSAKVKTVELHQEPGNGTLCGEMSLEFDLHAPADIESWTLKGGADGNTLKLDCADGVQLAVENWQSFYFVLPPCALDNGFSICFYDMENNMVKEQTFDACAPADHYVTRNHLNTVAVNGVMADPVLEGMLPGTFTVDERGSKVCFSQGNLEYNLHTGEWRFFDQQYALEEVTGESVGCNYANYDASHNGWISLFGWAANGINRNGSGSVLMPELTASESVYSINGVGNLQISEHADYDWGHNPISNGGNAPDVWRTMTANEYEYLFMERSASALNGVPNARFVMAVICDYSGIVLFPDSYIHPDDVTLPTNINDSEAYYASNLFGFDEWRKMELAGAVFLPANGKRESNDVTDDMSVVGRTNENGNYWTASCPGYYNIGTHSYSLLFRKKHVSFFDNRVRAIGMSVRLVHDVDR